MMLWAHGVKVSVRICEEFRDIGFVVVCRAT